MKRNVLVFGLMAGLFVTSMAIYAASQCYANPEGFEGNDLLGYLGMIVAFSFVFVGIKNYRDKYNGGILTFGKAFKTGLYITLVASGVYVVVWLFDYYLFIPDFIDKYTDHVLYQAKKDGATAVEIEEKAAEMADFKEMYKNPLFVVVATLLEVFPVGLVISLISALILKRKPAEAAVG